MSVNYSENVCEAISIITQKAIQGLSFDRTILCTITNTEKANEGIYTVTDGSSSYTATSQDHTLKVQDQVYVLIPNGDYSAEKIIISSKDNRSNQDKGYSQPIDTIIPVEVLKIDKSSVGLIANAKNDRKESTFIKILTPGEKKLSLGPKYTRLSVQGKFDTSKLAGVVTGDYGIILKVNGTNEEGKAVKDKLYVFQGNDFFGNPYNLTNTSQSVVFDISEFKEIETVEIWLQEDGNFYKADGTAFPKADSNNIIVSDLVFTFGFDVSEYGNNALLLSNLDALEYSDMKYKSLKLNWIRKRNNNTLFGIDEAGDIGSNFNYLNELYKKGYISTYWYRYKINSELLDPILNEDLWEMVRSGNNKNYDIKGKRTIKYDNKDYILYDIGNASYVYGYNSDNFGSTGIGTGKVARFNKFNLRYDAMVSVKELDFIGDKVSWKNTSNVIRTGYSYDWTDLNPLEKIEYKNKIYSIYDINNSSYVYGYNEAHFSADGGIGAGKIARFNKSTLKFNQAVSVTDLNFTTAGGVTWKSSDNETKTGNIYIDNPFKYNFSFKPSINNFREKIKAAIVINGCLREKNLIKQSITLSDKIIEGSVLKEIKDPLNPFKEDEKQLVPDYSETFYSPEEEISNINELLDSSSINKVKPYKYNEDKKTYEEDSNEYPEKVVEWVQQYKKTIISVDSDGIPVKKNGEFVYGNMELIYLTKDEYNNYLDLEYSYTEDKKKKYVKTYKLELNPITILKSNEIAYANDNDGKTYKQLNLIKDLELECLDSQKGSYFIYNMANTIPGAVANETRQIQASFKSINSTDVQSDNIILSWKYPKERTMLTEPYNFILDDAYQGVSGKIPGDTAEKNNIVNWMDGNVIASDIQKDLQKAKTTYQEYWIDEKPKTYKNYWISNKIIIKNSESGEADSTENYSFSIPYRITDYYTSNLSNNTISCYVQKRIDGASDSDVTINKSDFDLSFGPSGTHGTNYTFTLSLGYAYDKDYNKKSSSPRSFLTLSDGPTSGDNYTWVELVPKLYKGGNGNKLVEDCDFSKIEWSWLISPYFHEERTKGTETKKLKYRTVVTSVKNKKKFITVTRQNNLVSDLPEGWDASYETSEHFYGKNHCAVVKAKITYNSKDLEAYLSIPIRWSSTVSAYQGTERIVYTGGGTIPEYYREDHQLLDANSQQIKGVTWNTYVDRTLWDDYEGRNYAPTFLDTEIKCGDRTYKVYDSGNDTYLYGYGGPDDVDENGLQRLLRIKRKSNLEPEISSGKESYVSVYNCSVSKSGITLIWYTKNNTEDANKQEAKRFSPLLKAPSIYYSSESSTPVSLIAQNNTGDTLFVQPIFIIENRYGNSMLNEWDGKLKIDEDNNSVLAAQVAAGTKESDNSFTGVIMGKVATNDIDNATPSTGLYGYNKGSLVFGFTETGTAFLGKSGTGRILFNGNSGSITSQDFDDKGIGAKLNLATGDFTLKTEGRGSIFLSGKGTSSSPFLKITERANKMRKSYTVDGKTYNFYLYDIGHETYYYGYSSDDYFKNDNNKIDKLIRVKKSNLTYVSTMTNVSNVSFTTNYATMSFTYSGTDYTGTLYSTGEADQIIFYAAQGSYYLQSATYQANVLGMKINLDNGILVSQNIGGYIRLDPTNEKALFVVKDEEKNVLINIGNEDSYFLQSANWAPETIGTHLNLNTGVAQFKNTGGYIQINPSKSNSLFSVEDPYTNKLINIGTDNYYIQSADYISGTKGFRLNLSTHSFSLQQFLPKKDLSNAGIYLSNGSSQYFKIVKNRARLAKNVEFTAPGETAAQKYHMYTDPWGVNIYIRDCQTGIFYSITSKKSVAALPIGIERTTSTFTLQSYDKKEDYTGYKFRILGSVGLQNIVSNMSSKSQLDLSSDSNWSYNSSSDRLEHKNSTASSGKKYTSLYYPLEYAVANIRSDQFSRGLTDTGHTNSLAYSPSLNTFFAVRDTKCSMAGYICDFTDGTNSSTGKSYDLEISEDDTKSDVFWEIAIPRDNDTYLYGLAGYLYEYKYSSADKEYKLERQIASLSSFKDSKYEYQGMGADDKYVYLPRFKHNTKYQTQDIQVINISNGNQKTIISFTSIDPCYEVEEVDFLGGYMYVSFSRVNPGGSYASGYISKIYKFKYSNAKIPSSLDLVNDVIDSWIVINNIKTTHNSGQGFCIGKVTYLNSSNKKETNNCFINGFCDSTAGSNGLALINIMGGTNHQEAESVNLFFVSKDSYYLQSQNYRYSGIVGSVGNTGFNLNLETGRLNAFNFNIQLGKSDGSYVKIDSGASSSPIQVYGPPVTSGSRKRCVIGWNGVLTAEGGSFTDCDIKNGCKIGNWTIVSNHLSYNSGINSSEQGVFTNGKAFIAPSGVSASNAGENLPFTGNTASTKFVLGIGSRFGVTTYGTLCAKSAIIEGKITATEGKIGDCTIDSSGKLNVPAANITGTLSVGHIDTGSITIGANQVTSGTFVPARIPNLSVDKLTAGHLSGFTIQTGTSKNYVYLSSTGAEFRWGSTVYGKITTTNTVPTNNTIDSQDYYWTLLGQYNNIDAISLGFNRNGTPAYFLFKDQDLADDNYHSEHTFTGGNLMVKDGSVFVQDSVAASTFIGDVLTSKITVSNIIYGNQDAITSTVFRDSLGTRVGMVFKAPMKFANTTYDSSGNVITLSDQNQKNSISAISSYYEDLFMSLNPIIFKYNNGTSNRFHIGFIAQELLKSIQANNLTTQDFAAYVEYTEENNEETISTCGIRYSEFIALNTHMIQKCLKRIDELENEIKTLKAQL